MTTRRAGRSERRKEPLRAPRIARLAFFLAGGLIALAASALMAVGHVATREADAQARANAIRLFDNALRDRLFLIARDQLSVARWDRTVANVVLAFDKAYVREEMIDSLWNDYAHERTYVMAPDGRVLVAAARDRVDFSRRRLAAGHDIRVLAEKAERLYAANRIPIPGGFGARVVPREHLDQVAAMGFARIDGRPSLVSAMAIVPDQGTVALPAGPPMVLISARFIDAALLQDLNSQLAFPDLGFVDAEAEPANGNLETAQRPVVSSGHALLGRFVWRKDLPGAHIWSTVVPLIALISAGLLAAAVLVARQIGRLSLRLEASEARNRHLARHDALSGLANRLHFDAELAAAVAGLPRHAFAVLACDLDRFKAVNDTHGHAAGDTVIRTVAARLRAAVGANGLVARTGGDEFLVLVAGGSDRDRLDALARRIIEDVCAPIEIEAGATGVGVSIGIATAPRAGMSAAAIMAAADAALYRAKEHGRGIAVFADDPPAHASGPAASEHVPPFPAPEPALARG